MPVAEIPGFGEYLSAKAESYKFHPSVQRQWVEYMRGDFKRGRALLNRIVPLLRLKKNERALDIGSGFGGLCAAMEEWFENVHGIEILKERVEWSKKRAVRSYFQNGDGSRLPYQDNYFDLVVSTDVLEHMDPGRQRLAAKEISRVLNKSGKAYLEVPNKYQLLDEHNKVWFGTYLPPLCRKMYTRTFSKNKKYLQCWERSGNGWQKLFEDAGLQSKVVGYARMKSWLPPNRFEVYLESV